jgi:hypothetical protein
MCDLTKKLSLACAAQKTRAAGFYRAPIMAWPQVNEALMAMVEATGVTTFFRPWPFAFLYKRWIQ